MVDVGLNKDVALCALCADILPFAVKKTSRPNLHFLTQRPQREPQCSQRSLQTPTHPRYNYIPSVPFAPTSCPLRYKNLKAHPPFFNTKATKGAAKVRKGASKLLNVIAFTTFPLCPLRRHPALCGKKTQCPTAIFNTKATKGAAMFAKEPPNSYTPSL